MKENIETTFQTNISRVRTLISFYSSSQSGNSQNPSLADYDILRSAIVFLHATFEDLLRGVYKWKLSMQGGEKWKKIPLYGLSDKNQFKAFSFEDLYAHKTLSIEELFNKSLEEYLKYTNYNKIEDVVAILSDIGIDKSIFEALFPDLLKLFLRRHNIVHRADRKGTLDNLTTDLTPISDWEVNQWLNTVENFGKLLLDELQ
ncbi:HEPN domain-containing protein [Leptospira vanthielii]|nr:HEPN domain-containing protein [Leptospira vanthielii]